MWHQNLTFQILVLYSFASRIIVCQYDEMRDEFRHLLGVCATHSYHTSCDGFLIPSRNSAARDNNIAHEHIVIRAKLAWVYLFFLFNTVRDVGWFDDVYKGFDGEFVVLEVGGGGNDEIELFDILDSIGFGVERLVLAFSFNNEVCQLYLTR